MLREIIQYMLRYVLRIFCLLLLCGVNVSAQSFIELISPNGGEQLITGSIHNITWDAQGTSSFNIYASYNQGQNWVNIAQGIQGLQFPFIVPSNINSQSLIKVESAVNPSLADTSVSTFSIINSQPSIEVISPTAFSAVFAGFSYPITWNSANVSFVNILLSTNNGSSYLPVAQNIPAQSGQYNWMVLSSNSTTCRIKVEDASNPGIFGLSNQTFIINGNSPITLSYPVGGEIFLQGQSLTINWAAAGMTAVNIELSVNNGNSYSTIASNVPAALQNVTLNAPQQFSISCRIRISDASNPNVNAVSPASFSIVPPNINLFSPSPGIQLIPFTFTNIQWFSPFGNQPLKIDLSTDNGLSWTIIEENVPNTGIYNWFVPAVNSMQCILRISLQNNPLVQGFSVNTFMILSTNPLLHVDSPTGNTALSSGTQTLIQWQSYQVNNVRIEYSTDNGNTFQLIAPVVPALSGNYLWNVPDGISSGQCKIKISNAGNPTQFATNAGVFSIIQPSMQIIQPNNGSVFSENDNLTINWTVINGNLSSYINLWFSADSGITWQAINSMPIANSGSFNWVIPAQFTSQGKIKITDAFNPNLAFESSGVFSIQPGSPSLGISIPSTGTELLAQSTVIINWQSSGISDATLDYSVDGGNNWILISNNPNFQTKQTPWNIPNLNNQSCILRIRESNNPQLFAIVNGLMIKKRYLQFGTINLGQPVGANVPVPVEIQKIGVDFIDIYYSANNGQTWAMHDSALFVQTGFQVMFPSTGTYLLRIQATGMGQLADTTSINVIQNPEALNLYTLNQPILLVQGAQQLIAWTSSGIINEIDIEFSSDGGNSFVPIINAYPASFGQYMWTVPANSTSNGLIRISKTASPQIQSVSSIFSIQDNNPQINLVWPNGGESLEVNDFVIVEWSKQNIDKVDIFLSVDNGIYFTQIANDVEVNQILWQVPGLVSANCQIRIQSAANASLQSLNTVPFSINAPTASGQTIFPILNTNLSSCHGNTVVIPYYAFGSFGTQSSLSVQISQQSSFSQPINIGNTNSIDSIGSISCIIPSGLADGEYFIRLVGSHPALQSAASFFKLTIESIHSDFTAENTVAYIPGGKVKFIPNNLALTNTHLWNFSPVIPSSNLVSPEISFPSPGIYSVSLTITDIVSSCSSTTFKESYIHSSDWFPNRLIHQDNSAPDINALEHISESVAFAAASNGKCYLTSDSGKTWRMSETGLNHPLFTAARLTQSWFLGGTDGTLLRSINQGQSWQPINIQSGDNVYCIHFKGNNGLLGGSSGLLRRYNGNTWIAQNSGTNKSIRDFYMSDNYRLLIGDNGTIRRQTAVVWDSIISPISVNWHKVFFADELNGYAAGEHGSIIKTSDGGLNWQLLCTGLIHHLRDISVYGDTVMACGDNGLILLSTDNGNSFRKLNAGSDKDLNALTFRPGFSTYGYLAGESLSFRKFGTPPFVPLPQDSVPEPEGIQETSKNWDIRLYPNPTTDRLNIEFIGWENLDDIQIEIYEISGRLEKRINVPGHSHSGFYSLDVSNLPSGNYLLQVKNNYLFYSTGFVKTN
jgi:photosystem II stability/assembly factor-like uncharacterized protein